MISLYNIEQNLIDLFQTIEDNDGEITEEQLKELEINENNLKEKLDSYRKIINEWDSDIEKCKKEAKRLTGIAKVRENRITRLKTAMTNAVSMFGNSGKTNKFIELDDCRLSTRNNESVELDDKRIYNLKSYFIETIIELVDNNILATGNNLDLEGILANINNLHKGYTEIEEEYVPYTMDDLFNIRFEIKTKATIAELLQNKGLLTESIAVDYSDFEINDSNSKTDLKNAIKLGSDITCAKPINNISLLIK